MNLREKNSKDDDKSSTTTSSTTSDSESTKETTTAKQRHAKKSIQVGAAYQAVLPKCDVTKSKVREEQSKEGVLVWKPNETLNDDQLDNYLFMARSSHNYNIDQALALLTWHKHSFVKAIGDMSNFLPCQTEWTDEDKVLFEQAFLCHGKSFTKIRTALPDKTHGDLVNYFYLWKRTRSYKSLMENYVNKKESLAIDSSDENKSDSDGDTLVCSNCESLESKLESTVKGDLCMQCFNYWKQNGVMRPDYRYSLVNRTIQNKHYTSGPTTDLDRDSRRSLKALRKPPKGIYLNYEELMSLSELDQQNICARLDNTILSMKKKIQHAKASMSDLSCKFIDIDKIMNDCDDKTRGNTFKSTKWTQREAELAIQGFHVYKKDFSSIADIIETKTEECVREFYEYHRGYSNLDEILTNKRVFKSQNELKSQVQTLLKSNKSHATTRSQQQVLQTSDDSNDDIIILQ